MDLTCERITKWPLGFDIVVADAFLGIQGLKNEGDTYTYVM